MDLLVDAQHGGAGSARYSHRLIPEHAPIAGVEERLERVADLVAAITVSYVETRQNEATELSGRASLLRFDDFLEDCEDERGIGSAEKRLFLPAGADESSVDVFDPHFDFFASCQREVMDDDLGEGSEEFGGGRRAGGAGKRGWRVDSAIGTASRSTAGADATVAT